MESVSFGLTGKNDGKEASGFRSAQFDALWSKHLQGDLPRNPIGYEGLLGCIKRALTLAPMVGVCWMMYAFRSCLQPSQLSSFQR